MRILIFNYHVPYLYNLAGTGHEFFVLNPPGRFWDERMRPKPDNIKIISDPKDYFDLFFVLKNNPKFFDRIILQDNYVQYNNNLDFFDRITTMDLEVPKIMLFHNSFQTQFRNVPYEKWSEIKKYLKNLLKGIKLVFISEMKKNSYGFDGYVILPGINMADFGGYSPEDDNSVLTCLNNANYRDFMNGTEKMKMVCCDLNFIILGEEGHYSNLASSFEELKNKYKKTKWYIALNNPEYEDGYNLSMLEAMATGVPVATLNHPTSPIEHLVSGIKTDDLQEINYLIHTIPKEKCIEMGREARKIVAEKFSYETFLENWNIILKGE